MTLLLLLLRLRRRESIAPVLGLGLGLVHTHTHSHTVVGGRSARLRRQGRRAQRWLLCAGDRGPVDCHATHIILCVLLLLLLLLLQLLWAEGGCAAEAGEGCGCSVPIPIPMPIPMLLIPMLMLLLLLRGGGIPGDDGVNGANRESGVAARCGRRLGGGLCVALLGVDQLNDAVSCFFSGAGPKLEPISLLLLLAPPQPGLLVPLLGLLLPKTRSAKASPSPPEEPVLAPGMPPNDRNSPAPLLVLLGPEDDNSCSLRVCSCSIFDESDLIVAMNAWNCNCRLALERIT